MQVQTYGYFCNLHCTFTIVLKYCLDIIAPAHPTVDHFLILWLEEASSRFYYFSLYEDTRWLVSLRRGGEGKLLTSARGDG